MPALIIFLLLFAAWVTHVIACISKGMILLLIVGAFIFPIGIVHGVAVWFGVV